MGFFGGTNGPRIKNQEVTAYIVETSTPPPPPPPPLPPPPHTHNHALLKGDITFQKLSHVGAGVPNFLLESGNEPKMMGLIKKWRGC